MKFLEQVQADVKKAVLQHQRDFLLQVLQQRAGELTFGDLRVLLASQLGQGLSEVRVAELFPMLPATAVPSPPTAAKPTRQPKRAAPSKKSPKSTAARPKGRGKDRARSRKAGTHKAAEAVIAVLLSASTPLSSSEVAAKLKVDRGTARTILQKLSEANKVVVTGSAKYTRYSVAPPRATPQSPSKPRKAAAAGKSKQASEQPIAGSQSDYDAAIVAKLRANGWTSSTEVRAAVGGTIDTVRAALQRLIGAQQVTRVGERKFTRYAIWGRTPQEG